MWIYIPTAGSTSSPSAPEVGASTAPLSWQSHALARSCVWRGSRSPALIWSRRCNKVSWLRHLSGLMPEPSTADHGAALWMASLVGFPASPIPSPANDLDAKTSAISGISPGASSFNPGPGSSSLKTSAGCSAVAAPKEYAETYSAWVARLREDCSRRRKSARARNASGFSSLGWPTATVAGNYNRKGLSAQSGDGLATSVAAWPTPTSMSFKDSHQPGNSASMNATMALASNLERNIWPTATATERPRSDETMAKSAAYRKRKAGQTTVPLYLGEAAALWPTPASRDFKGVDRTDIDRGNARPLNEVVAHWATPRATDGEKGGPNQSFGAGGVPLPAMASQWGAPTTAIATGGQTSRSGSRKGELLLSGQAMALCSPLALETSRPGAGSPSTTLNAYLRCRATTCSQLRSEKRALVLMGVRSLGKGWSKKRRAPFVRPSFRRSLNPLFVGDLMGWPPGLTSFECSETASSIWRARMRSALLSLDLADAPPAQLSLWG